MSGNFAIKGGGRTPNGKCHLKFPFWFFDYLPKGLEKGYFQQVLEHHHCEREAALTNGASARSKGEPGLLTTDSTSAAAGFTQHYTSHRRFRRITTGRYICGGLMGSDG